MKLSTITLALALAVPVLAFGDKTDYYEAYSFEYAGVTLPYRQLTLNPDMEGDALIVIQLHGGSARGNDNVAQLNAAAVDSVENFLANYPVRSIFLLPQCASNRQWNESPRTQPTPMTDILTQWLNDFISNNDVNTNRIYITGYSMGGSGTWRMLNDNPETFAAACIAAANPIMVEAVNVCHTPVWAVAGSNDQIMDAARIQNFVSTIQELGGDAHFSLLEGMDHIGTCYIAFTNERLEWMLSKGIENVDLPAGDVTGDYIIDIEDVNAAINIILKVKTQTDYPGSADLNGDGFIDVEDVNTIINIILHQ